MKYKIWDGQLKQYAFQEQIFNNKKEAIEHLISFFSVDCWGDLTKIRKTLWSDTEFSEMYLEQIES